MPHAHKSRIGNMLQPHVYKTFFVKKGQGFVGNILFGRFHRGKSNG